MTPAGSRTTAPGTPEEIFDAARSRERFSSWCTSSPGSGSCCCGPMVFSVGQRAQHYATWEWHVLPASAVTELTAVSIFGANVMLTFASRLPVPA